MMKNKVVLLTPVLLIISIVNYLRIVGDGNVRTVDFISIFTIGALTGILYVQIVIAIKNRRKNS